MSASVSGLRERPHTQVSVGERQVALVARALAQEPRLIVLDEPTASLDSGNQGKVLREMRRLAASGIAVIFSSHDPNHVLRFADRCMLIRDGSTLASSALSEVITQEHLRSFYRAEVLEVGTGFEAAYLPA